MHTVKYIHTYIQTSHTYSFIHTHAAITVSLMNVSAAPEQTFHVLCSLHHHHCCRFLCLCPASRPLLEAHTFLNLCLQLLGVAVLGCPCSCACGGECGSKCGCKCGNKCGCKWGYSWRSRKWNVASLYRRIIQLGRLVKVCVCGGECFYLCVCGFFFSFLFLSFFLYIFCNFYVCQQVCMYCLMSHLITQVFKSGHE